MKRRNFAAVCLCLVCSWIAANAAAAEPTAKAADASLFGEFVGSSPCQESLRPLVGIPAAGQVDLLEWKLTLSQDPRTKAPTTYHLRCRYGLVVQGQPGIGKETATAEKKGKWSITKGTAANPAVVVYELEGSIALAAIHQNVLQILQRDRSLMVGNGGWSYTLNRSDAAEKPGDRELALARPSISYSIAPLSTGANVFGVFEGRTPYQGIARLLKKPTDAGDLKAKWRVTLYQDADTRKPTTYKIEGSLFRKGAREGKWSIVRGSKDDPSAVVYRLAPNKDEANLQLLKGDDNVLFFLDTSEQPLVGHADFSYTLDRRDTSVPVSK